MITLVTGVIGHGKTQRAMQLILEYIEENHKRVERGEEPRQIYCDINGINEEGRPPLPIIKIDDDFDWRDTPEESLIVYDECQEKDWIRDKPGALSDDWRIRAMEKSRHGQRDILLICQDPIYLHTHVRGLVSPHHHCIRPLNAKFTNVFIFNLYQKTPVTASKKADDQVILYLSKKYGQYYKSAVAHNEKFYLPKKVKILLSVTIIVSLYASYKIYNSFFNKPKPVEQAEKSQPKNTQTKSNNIPQKTLASELDRVLNPRQKPELVKAKYQRQLHYETAYDEDVRVAMVISTENKCLASNSFGEPLNIDYKTCMSMSKNPRLIPRRRVKNESPLDNLDSGFKEKVSEVNPVS